MANNVTSLDGNDTLITLDSDDTITLRSLPIGSLHASDFILHVASRTAAIRLPNWAQASVLQMA